MSENLISEIYDAPLAQQPWTGLLTTLKALTNSDRAMFTFELPTAPERSIMAADGESEQRFKDLYWRSYRFKDPISYRSILPGQIAQFEDVIDLDELFASEFYQGLCSHLDSRYAFFCNLGVHDGRAVWLRASRNSGKGRYSGEEADRIRALVPHLSRAARTYCRMETCRAETSFYADTIADLGIGMIALDRDGRVIGSNPAAERVMDHHAPGFRMGRKLSLLGCDAARQASALRSLREGTETVLPLTGEDRDGGLVNMVIRRARGPAFGGEGAAAFAVVFVAPDDCGLTQQGVSFTSRAWGLTTSEARLALLLAAGHDLKNIAKQLDITPTTARTYCKRILEKTGLSRQSEIVRLLLGSFVRLA